MGLKFCSDFFWVRDFGKDFFGVDKKGTQGSRFYVKQLYHDAKIVWNSLELFFLIGLFLGCILGRWTFFGSGSSLKDFFGSNNFASFAHPHH